MNRSVYLFTVAVIDHRGVGENELIRQVEEFNDLGGTVVDFQSREIDWHDEHPTNFTDQKYDAFRKLFAHR